jgi:peptidylamidoglycolate lyase
MKKSLTFLIVVFGFIALCRANSDEEPSLPFHVVENWPQLPAGWIFGECSGVTVDREDHVWVFSRGSHPIVEFDSDGRIIKAWNDLPIKSSHGIRVDVEGNVWLIDVAGHRLLKLSPEGTLRMVIGANGGAPGNNESKEAFNRPTNVAFAPDGSFFVGDGYVNSRVVKFSKDGEYQLHWGEKGSGDGQFNLVHDLALDAQGRVYVADRENNRIQIFTQDGKYLGKWTGFGSPWALWYVAAQNAPYVADGPGDRIFKLDMHGKILGVLGSHGKAPGTLDWPHALAVDSKGAIYVAEIRNWRVQKFVPSVAP